MEMCYVFCGVLWVSYNLCVFVLNKCRKAQGSIVKTCNIVHILSSLINPQTGIQLSPIFSFSLSESTTSAPSGSSTGKSSLVPSSLECFPSHLILKAAI